MESKTEMRHKLYENFLKEFPLESLKSMPLERYTNLKRDDSFCYWVESRTYELGSIWGGASYKFGIYKYAKRPDNPGIIVSDEEYAWYTANMREHGGSEQVRMYKGFAYVFRGKKARTLVTVISTGINEGECVC